MISRCIIVILLSFVSRLAWPQNIWEPASGPDGPQDTRAVAINSRHLIFAATSIGIYRSDNFGDDWSKFNSGLTNTNVMSIVIDSKDRIFAGTYQGKIYLSTDDGNSWSASSNGFTDSNVYFLSIGRNDILYAGTPSGHVFRSTTNGKSWVNISPQATDMNSLVVDSLDVIYSGGSRIFRSTNQGASWDSIAIHSSATTMAVDSHNQLFLGNQSGLFVSSDSGSNWVRLPLGNWQKFPYPPFDSFVRANSITAIACQNSAILTTSSVGKCISRDGGNTWILVNSYFALQLNTTGRDSSGILFAGSGLGVHRSSDSGATWHRVNHSELTPGRIFSLAKSSSGRLFAATDYGVYVSSDDGDHWSLSLNGGYVVVATFDSNLVFANTNGDFYRSSDGGATWAGISSGIYNFVASSKGHLAARSSLFDAPNYLAGSDDQGLSWHPLSRTPNTDFYRCVAFATSGELYTGTTGGMFRSSDYGHTWESIASVGDGSVLSITPMENGSLFDYVGGQYRSTDHGVSWSPVSAGEGGVCNKEGVLFVGSSRSTDNGNTWTTFLPAFL